MNQKCNGRLRITSQSGSVPESPYLRIWQASKKRNYVIHQILVVNNRVLALFDQSLDEIAEIAAKFLPLRTSHDHRIFATFLNAKIFSILTLKCEELNIFFITSSNSSVMRRMMAACSMLFCIWAVIFPLQPEALIKNCMMALNPESRSALYCSIHSSTTCWNLT